MILLNLSHPLTPDQLEAIGRVTGQPVEDWQAFWYDGTPGTGFTATGVAEGYALRITPRMEAAPLMVIGDSFASGASGTMSFISASDMAWEAQPFEQTIGGYLEDLLPALNYINHGIGSSRASHWATTGNDYVTTYATAFSPRAAIISLGANDGVAGQTVAQLMASMVNVIHKLQSVGVLPILTTVLQTDVTNYSWMNDYCEAIQKLAHSRGLPCIDGLRVLASSTSDAARDTAIFGSGTHPNAAGYRALAMAIAQQVVFAPSYVSLGRIEDASLTEAKHATDVFDAIQVVAEAGTSSSLNARGLLTAMPEITGPATAPATPSPGQALMLDYMKSRNACNTTVNDREIMNDAGAVVLTASVVSDAVHTNQGKLGAPT